ncbi:hypothetical protein C0Q70_03903 [Pomacea canaliculata]|uniref:Transmembrane protein 26 n=1 Tax=Pomacea canaliculata TaxID=400727 RepID=A0A2T7PU45_POMCA|nr:hypothetical protein C0Q70_03903 [Pomacea canaliculata]
MSWLSVARAVVVRLMFAVHGLVSIWRLAVVTHEIRFWYLATVLGVLLLEMTVTLGKKGGKEWKWFCPSVFIYLMCVVPAIWFLELHEMEKRIRELYRANVSTITHDLLMADNETGEELSASQLEIRIPLQLTSDQWIRTLEQLLLLLLILGRWLLPKGKLTHDQLSQLLLVYIGTAADIVEFFDAFKEKRGRVRYNRILCIVILGIWSFSLIQFSLVLTATRARRDQSGLVPTRKRYKASGETVGCCSADVYGIIISIMLQDLPFLVLRMLLIFKYKVLSYTNMFFTSKNTIVIILLIYRLIVVQIEKRKEMNENLDSNLLKERGRRLAESVSLTPSSCSGKSRLIKSESDFSNGIYDPFRCPTPVHRQSTGSLGTIGHNLSPFVGGGSGTVGRSGADHRWSRTCTMENLTFSGVIPALTTPWISMCGRGRGEDRAGECVWMWMCFERTDPLEV